MFAKIALFVPSSNWLMLPEHLPCLLRNLYAKHVVKKQQLERYMEQLMGSKLGKE